MDLKKILYESELFFEPHLDTHTIREAEEEMADFSALELKTLNQEMVNWLSSTFPRVTKLRFILGDDNELSIVMVYVLQLLEHWAKKLESVGIWTELNSFDFDEYPNLFQSLFAVINEKFHSQQSLTLDIPWYTNVSFNLDFSFIGRLKLFSTSLNIDSFDNPEQFLDSSHLLLENLPEIRLFGTTDPAKVQALPPRLASKITVLNSGDIVYRTENGYPNYLPLRFPALKWYSQVGFENDTDLGFFFIALSKLSHLAFLKLVNVPFCSPERFQFQQELPPFHSLETLSISDSSIPDMHFLQILGPLDRLFPALKTIKLVLEKFYDSTETAPIRSWLPNGERRKSVYHSASKPRMEEIFGGLMRQFAQLGLKGSLRVRLRYRVFQEDTDDEEYTYFYNYAEEFNFSDGVPMEDWHFKEENIRDDDDFDGSEDVSIDYSDSD